MKRFLTLFLTAALAASCGVRSPETETFTRNILLPLPDGAPRQMAEDSLRIVYNLVLPVGQKWADAREAIIGSVIAEDAYAGDDTLSIDTHIKSLQNDYFQEFGYFMERYAKDGYGDYLPPFAYNYDFSGKFLEICKDRKYVTYKINCDTYTGGAHGMYWETYLTFNLETGNRVYLSEVVPEEKLPALRDILYVKLSETDGFIPDYIGEDTELATENVLYADSALTFVYNPYDVAPYSSGIMTASVNWEELANL